MKSGRATSKMNIQDQESKIIRGLLKIAENKNGIGEVHSPDGNLLKFRYMKVREYSESDGKKCEEIYVGIKINQSNYSVYIRNHKIERLYICRDDDEQSAYLPADHCIDRLEKFFR